MDHKDVGAELADIHRKNLVVPNKIRDLLNTCRDLVNNIDIELYGDSGSGIVSGSNRFEKATLSLFT